MDWECVDIVCDVTTICVDDALVTVETFIDEDFEGIAISLSLIDVYMFVSSRELLSMMMVGIMSDDEI